MDLFEDPQDHERSIFYNDEIEEVIRMSSSDESSEEEDDKKKKIPPI